MKEWLIHNTDKLLLYSLVVLGGIFMIHLLHHGSPDEKLLAWLENAFSTVLGALILILTGRTSQPVPPVVVEPKTNGGPK